MKIGIFTCNYKPLINGLSSSIEIFSREFKAQGHEVFIFAPQYPGHIEREEGVFRFPSLRAPTHHQYTLPLPFSPRVQAALPKLRLDLLHAQHPFLLGNFALRAARRLNLPLVFTHHTLYEEYAHYLPLASGWVRRSAIRRSTSFANCADLVIAPTRGLKEILAQRGVRTRIEVVPTGVEMEEEGKRTFHPEDLDIPSSAKILLSVGRLAKEKNLIFLLSVFSRLSSEFPDCYLILLGDGDERTRLEAWAKKRGLEAKVRFLGARPRTQLGRFYRGAHLLLFPSLSEAQGLVVAESMAQGLPVVALRSFAAEDLIEDGMNGYLAEGQEMFLDRVRDLLWHEEKRKSFGEKARETARKFSASAMGAKMLHLYQELLEARKER
jgi:glycosyltransferase involved in cell wall biosynthesis